MANLNGFDAREVEPQAAFEPIPADKYLVVISASEMKTTKAGDGSYLELTFQIIEGDDNDVGCIQKAHHSGNPLLPLGLVFPGDVHQSKQAFRQFDLAVPVNADEFSRRKVRICSDAGQEPFFHGFPHGLQDFATDDDEAPCLSVVG